MGKSYQKHPYCTHIKNRGRGVAKGFKRVANHTVKNYENIPNGSSFKKVYDTYSICDYKFYETENEFKKWFLEMYGREPTKRETFKLYKRFYINK